MMTQKQQTTMVTVDQNKSKISNLIERSISAIIFGLIVILMIDLSDATFNILWIALGILSLGEFLILMNSGGGIKKLGKVWLCIGILYILLTYVLLIFDFKNIFFHGEESHRSLVLMIITLIWSNDVGAYLVGITLGKHKMAPKISPKKSWEGFAGGIIFTIITSILWKLLYWDPIVREWNEDYLFFMIFGVVAALAAVVGDLLESKFKRILGIKDSGKFLPGHGGVLDRMDSLLLTVPVTSIYIHIFYMF